MNLPRVFMIGWEFPPHNSGGLGTACQGLTAALAREYVSQIFVLPHSMPINSDFVEILYPSNPYFKKIHVNMHLRPYSRMSREQYLYLKTRNNNFANSMISDVYQYAEMVQSLAGNYPHDVIHGHDWMTYPAALASRNVSKKPVVLHVHSTEYDRTLNDSIDQEIAKIEKESLMSADKIIAVSEYTKGIICDRYGISDYKINVVHNGVDFSECNKYQISYDDLKTFAGNKKVVVFMGRITCQKGPDYFIQAACKIAREVPEALFVVGGNGDMYEQIIMQSTANRLTGKLLFAGFLRNREKEFLFKRADLFIMPSVSEPFGIVALEAAIHNTPVIISKQSGVKEVFKNALTVDYWDSNKMADLAINILKNDEYRSQLGFWSSEEAKSVTWDKAAKKCVSIYRQVVSS